MINNKKYAFSLPEVAITLGVIGILAVMTIPTLIQNANAKRFTSQFKKTLSMLNQAAITAQANYDINYSMLSATSDSSNCENDTIAAGKYNMCGLFNNTMRSHTFSGIYGEVKGVDNVALYSATVTSFPIENFLIFSFNDGSFVAFNPNAKECGVGPKNVLTIDMITEGKLSNCVGFIDVNGPKPPNTEISCSSGSTEISTNTICQITSETIADIYPIVFHDGSVEPMTNASLAALWDAETKMKDLSSDIADFKKVTFKDKEYELKNGIYLTEDSNGNYVDGSGNTYTKNSEGNYTASDGYVYDKDMNTIGRNYNGYWFDYKGDVLVRSTGNNKYKGQGGMTYTPNSNGGYNRSDGAVLDSNFNILGMNKNGSWYDYKNGFFVKENADGNYSGSDGKLYTKDSQGRYVNNNTYYDKDMNIVGEIYKNNWFDYRSGLFVRKIDDQTYKGHSMTYKINDDGYYERSDGNVYDEEFVLIGHK